MLTLANDPYYHLRPYIPGKPVEETERELGITGVVKLASNENPLGPSPRALAAIAEHAHRVNDYPDGGCFYLRHKLAAHLEVSPDALVFGNGATELIEMLVRTCLRPHENMIHVQGSFIYYLLAGQATGCEIVQVPMRELRYDLQAVAEAITPRTKLVFIANPNNPTGTYVTRDELRSFLATIPEQVVVVLDEAYFEYPTATDYPNGLSLLPERERLVVLRTFSKAYGLAGLRIGYAVMHPELADLLNRGREPFNVNLLGQVAACAALDDQAHVVRSREVNRQQMELLGAALRERGYKVTPSQANFLFVDTGRECQTVFRKLMERGVIVRPMGGYGFPTAVRITVGAAEQNQKLLAAAGQ